MIDVAVLPSVSFKNLRALPEDCGVYFVTDGEPPTVMYVGQSFRIRTRISNHSRKRDFLQLPMGRVAWHLVPYEDLSSVEIAMIEFFNPCLNAMRGGNTRPITKAALYKRLTIRIPEDILSMLQDQADEFARPMNTQIISVLRAGLGLGTKRAPKAPEP